MLGHARSANHPGGRAVLGHQGRADVRPDGAAPAVSFEMSSAGGVPSMGNLTGAHEGEKMAVLLDDEVYTPPPPAESQEPDRRPGRDRGRLYNRGNQLHPSRARGQAGSLTAKLSPEPISIESVGPQLGADNLQKGLHSGVIAFIVVSAFMVFYYFSSGIIAVFALACAGLLMVAMMALQHTSFTLACDRGHRADVRPGGGRERAGVRTHA